MKYLSKGCVQQASTEHILHVNRCGSEYTLHGPAAAVWLAGRFGIAEPQSQREKNALQQLQKMGLVEISEGDNKTGVYRMITNCVLVRARPKRLHRYLSRKERIMLKWITYSGLHLTPAEAIFLEINHISPESHLLGKENTRRLIETIYSAENIKDNLLEAEMERASGRDAAVSTILGLLRKKRLILL